MDTWLFHFNTQVAIAHVPDGDKIGVASGLCSGYALQTLRSYVTREGDRATWTGLSELFKTTFRPVGHEKLLRERLISLRQTNTVAEYCNEFLSILAEYNADDFPVHQGTQIVTATVRR